MVTRTLAIALPLVVELACLGAPSSSSSSSEKTTMNPDISMTTRVARDGEQLLVGYEVRNRSSHDIYLLNRLYRSSPAWRMDPSVVYVRLDKPTATVMLAKRIPDLPEGVSVTAPFSPFVTPVRASQTFRETFALPLPLVTYEQYARKQPRPSGTTATATYRHVNFTIGYYIAPEATIEEERDVQGSKVIIPKIPAGRRPEFSGLTSAVFDVAVPVLED